ncbi:MAG: T9SS type A sorting domain-containing protein [Bacteroidales bacterium]|nr:T9SS type A sorting domain-containing protein [Bacteroidales bacterium]
MKKNIFLILFISVLGLSNTFAQCTPIPFGGGELTNPDTVQGIAPAAETQPYSQIIHMRIPADTIYNGAVIPIDSIGITTIVGLPLNITWLTNMDNNYWPGDTFGCIIFEGTPALGDAGIYYIEINVEVNALGTSMPYIMYYDFEVLDTSHVGIKMVKLTDFKLTQNQPNPFNSSTNINFFMPKANNVQFVVYDILGNIVYSNEYYYSRGVNTITFNKSNLNSGVYIYELVNGNKALRKRMVIR